MSQILDSKSYNSPTIQYLSTHDDAFHADLKNDLACCSITVLVGCTQNINTSKTQKNIQTWHQ